MVLFLFVQIFFFCTLYIDAHISAQNRDTIDFELTLQSVQISLSGTVKIASKSAGSIVQTADFT